MHNRATIREITQSIGIDTAGDDIAVLMTLDGNGPRFWTLSEAADWFPDQADALYLASGRFAANTVKRKSGKTRDNLSRVIWLPWDADLLDYLGAPAKGGDRETAAANLHAMAQDDIDALVYQLRADVETAFAAVQIPIHRLDYTGYGLCAYTYVAADDQARIDDARAVHKIGIDLVNRFHGSPLIDPQTSDAGTRVTRLPYSWNKKNPDIPRLVRTLVAWQGQSVPLPTVERAERTAIPPNPRSIPYDGDPMAPDDLTWIVEAMRPFWTLGQKHAVALALSGMLAKAGVPELLAEQIIDALSVDDQRRDDRFAGLRRSYERARSGADLVAGYTAMRSLIDPAVLDGLDRILGRYAARGGATVSGIEELTKVAAESIRTSPNGHSEPSGVNEHIPPECMTGWLADYVALMEPLSESPSSFHFACGLTLAGSTFGRVVANEYVSKPLYPNLYTMLVGNAGTSRKDTAIRFALDLPMRMPSSRGHVQVHKTPFQIATDVGSAEGMIKFLSENPNTLLYITEYKRLAQNAHRQSTATILSVLTAAWDTPITLDVTTKANPISARFPFLSILAAVQPNILAQEMTPEDIESGYATRWLFVPGSGTDPRPDPPNIDDDAAFELYGRLLRMRERYASLANARVPLDATARKRWIEWYDHDRRRSVRNDDEDSMRSRLGTHVRKIALIYAACEGADTITPHHLEPAIAFIEWAWTNTVHLLRDWAQPVGKQVEHKIIDVLKQNGPTTRRDLQRKCQGRKWNTREYHAMLEVLIKTDRVLVLPDGSMVLTP